MKTLRTIKRRINNLLGFGKKNPILLLPYQTYGTSSMIYLRGRVLEDKNIRPSKNDRIWEVIKNTYKRFRTEEKPNVTVTATIEGITYQAVTNEEGYFKIRKNMPEIDVNHHQNNWVDVNYSIQESSKEFATQMLIPNASCDFGIISDIDDTVLHTDVASFMKLKLMYNSFLKNATDRLPLEGASAFYRALQRGKSKNAHNPFFYISNSPWNLYNYLRIFLKESDFPKGPVLLRDFALPWQKNYRTEKGHKQREIRTIFQTYPTMKFILFGDSAEHDATIYSDVAREYPDQVICIYLHSVKKKSKMEYVQSIISASKHVEMVLINNALQGAEHALNSNLITQEDYENILKEIDTPKH